jgi:hypothetical protein
MARPGGKDRGITQRKGREGWWVRIFHNGRERWHKCDTKSQAKALYGRLKAEAREGKYFPDRFKQQHDLTLRAWIGRYRDGITSRGLRNMHHYGRFWSKLLGRRLLTEIAPDELRHIQAKMIAKKKRTPQTINRYFAALRRVLNLSIAEGYLVTNPVKAVKFFPEPSGRLRFLSDIEITAIKKQVYMPALERAGIKGATWHTLRHTFASRAVMGGVDIRTVQELMGHSTVTMTMRYAHLSPEHLKQAVNKGSLGCLAVQQSEDATVTKTVTCESQAKNQDTQVQAEGIDSIEEGFGGAGRVRTAASQFCRLLP